MSRLRMPAHRSSSRQPVPGASQIRDAGVARPVVGFLAVWAAVLVMTVSAILLLNGGQFAYTLDDPYIHLALAERIAEGHYGLNLEEPSSPSSSILWPLMLAPFAHMAIFEWMPLVFGALSIAGAIVALVRHLYRRLSPPLTDGTRTLALVLLFLGANFLGMPLNGMEHSLQLLLAAWVALGLIDLVEDDRVTPLFVLGLICGPLVRFENTSLMLMGAAILVLRGHRRTALAAVAVTTLAMATFAWFLTSQGLPPLPSSVLVKAAATSATTATSFWVELGENVLEGLAKPRMLLVLAAVFLLWRQARADSERAESDRLYVLFLVGVLGAHMAVGGYNAYGRYEVYVLLVAAVLLLHAFRASLAELVAARRRWAIAGLILGSLSLGFNQIHATVTAPLSANDVFEMHGGMNRLAVDFWKGPVGVNDVGWVSLHNPYYVLDLWGLASEDARKARQNSGGNDWAEQSAGEHGVDLLILFEDWFAEDGPLPPTWEKVAVLHTSGPLIQIPKSVTLFLRNSGRREELVRTLREWQTTLPAGTELQRFDRRSAASVENDVRPRPPDLRP